jgi:hypothetical protein
MNTPLLYFYDPERGRFDLVTYGVWIHTPCARCGALCLLAGPPPARVPDPRHICMECARPLRWKIRRGLRRYWSQLWPGRKGGE